MIKPVFTIFCQVERGGPRVACGGKAGRVHARPLQTQRLELGLDELQVGVDHWVLACVLALFGALLDAVWDMRKEACLMDGFVWSWKSSFWLCFKQYNWIVRKIRHKHPKKRFKFGFSIFWVFGVWVWVFCKSLANFELDNLKYKQKFQVFGYGF